MGKVMIQKLTLITAAIVFTLLTVVLSGGEISSAEQKLKENVCASCHQDFKSILPNMHPAIGDGDTITCLDCHVPAGSAEPTVFSKYIHKVHNSKKIKLECHSCHIF
jgi:nitrate/TMAO reductase-like tetraheme cytochrome c subunit